MRLSKRVRTHVAGPRLGRRVPHREAPPQNDRSRRFYYSLLSTGGRGGGAARRRFSAVHRRRDGRVRVSTVLGFAIARRRARGPGDGRPRAAGGLAGDFVLGLGSVESRLAGRRAGPPRGAGGGEMRGDGRLQSVAAGGRGVRAVVDRRRARRRGRRVLLRVLLRGGLPRRVI